MISLMLIGIIHLVSGIWALPGSCADTNGDECVGNEQSGDVNALLQLMSAAPKPPQLWVEVPDVPSSSKTALKSTQPVLQSASGGRSRVEISQVLYGWKPTSNKLIPLYHHNGARLFDAGVIDSFIRAKSAVQPVEHINKVVVEGDSASSFSSTLAGSMSVEGSYGVPMGPSIEASVSAEFSVKKKQFHQLKFAQRRVLVQKCTFTMPDAELYPSDLHKLLSKEARKALESVSTSGEAERLVDRLGLFYLSKATYGALMTMSMKRERWSNQSTSDMKASLEASYNEIVVSVKGSASIHKGENKKDGKGESRYDLDAIGGNSTVLFSDGFESWAATVSQTPIVIEYKLAPLFVLVGEGSARDLLKGAVIKKASKCSTCPPIGDVLYGALTSPDDSNKCLGLFERRTIDTGTRIMTTTIALVSCPDNGGSNQWIVPIGAGKIRWMKDPDYCITYFETHYDHWFARDKCSQEHGSDEYKNQLFISEAGAGEVGELKLKFPSPWVDSKQAGRTLGTFRMPKQ